VIFKKIIYPVLLVSLIVFGCKKNNSPQLTKLDNNLSVITKPSDNRDIAAVILAVKAGSIYEKESVNGISRLVQKVLFKKSREYRDIQREIDLFGGRFYSRTTRDFTIFSVVVRKEYINDILSIFADAVINPVITDSLICTGKKSILSDIERRKGDISNILIKEFFKHAYTKHPYRLSPAGSEKGIRNITDHILKNYYKSLYVPENMTLVVAGDIKRKVVEEKCRELFGEFKGSPVLDFSWSQEPEQNRAKDIVIKSCRASGDAAVVSVGWHSPGIRNRDTFTMDIILQILGIGISSRLNNQLTEKMADVYWTWGNYITSREPGCFVLYAACSPEIAEKVKRTMLKEVRVLRNDSITPKELEKARMYYVAGEAYNLENILDCAYSLAFWSINKDFYFAETYLNNIKKVSAEDVQRVANKYLSADSYISVILYPENPEEKVR